MLNCELKHGAYPCLCQCCKRHVNQILGTNGSITTGRLMNGSENFQLCQVAVDSYRTVQSFYESSLRDNL